MDGINPTNPPLGGRNFDPLGSITGDNIGPLNNVGDAGKTTDKINLRFTQTVGGSNPVKEEDPLPPPEEQDPEVIVDTALKINTSFSLNDLYAILVLLQECANKQRSAAREVRQADYESQKQAILGEAAKTESAAIAGLATGIVGAVVSAGMTITSAVMGCKGISAKINKLGDYKVGEFSKNLSKANGKLDSATNDLKAFKSDMAKKYPAEVPDQPAAGKPMPQQGADAVGKDGVQVGKNGAQVGKNGAQVGKDGAQVGKDGAKVGKDGAKVGKDGAKVGKDGVKADEAADIPEELPTELGDKIDASKMTPEENAQWEALKGKYNDAAADVKAAQNDMDHVMEQLTNDPAYIEAEQTIQKSGLWQAGAQTISGFCSTLSQTLNQLFQARATVEGAKVKDAEQESEQENDLFQQAGQLRQEVIQLLQALNQIEKDSLGKVVNAI